MFPNFLCVIFTTVVALKTKSKPYTRRTIPQNGCLLSTSCCLVWTSGKKKKEHPLPFPKSSEISRDTLRVSFEAPGRRSKAALESLTGLVADQRVFLMKPGSEWAGSWCLAHPCAFSARGSCPPHTTVVTVWLLLN